MVLINLVRYSLAGFYLLGRCYHHHNLITINKVNSRYNCVKASFHTSRKSQTIGDSTSTISRPSQILPTNELEIEDTPDRLDGWRQIGKIGSVSIFPTQPGFFFLLWLAIIPNMKTQICTVGDVGDSFSSLSILLIAWLQLPPQN